jgi:exodeoxyribonuclease VII large subunit
MDTFRLPQQSERPYTVSEINSGVSAAIEASNTLVWVEGELSNFRCASSGHWYGKLKDAHSQIPVVVWRSTALKLQFEPEDGMAVMVIASLRVYQRGGYYQLDIHRMQETGRGALALAFEKLKKRLAAEGLFDQDQKKPLPERIHTLGVITAKTGAAIHDICTVAAKRAPRTDILLRSVPVQGEQAPRAIAAAIQDMNEYGRADCLIVGRGGGSIEDLWAFNDERVARAIYGSRLPVISAVGHEIDFTIADFVADMRAPTPSAAAEIALPDERENFRYFEGVCQRFTIAFQRALWDKRTSFHALGQRPALRRPVRMIAEARQRFDELEQRQRRAFCGSYQRMRLHLSHAAHRLEALSPLAVLSRGYSVVTDDRGKLVRSASALEIDQPVRLRFQSGEASARITRVKTDE